MVLSLVKLGASFGGLWIWTQEACSSYSHSTNIYEDVACVGAKLYRRQTVSLSSQGMTSLKTSQVNGYGWRKSTPVAREGQGEL